MSTFQNCERGILTKLGMTVQYHVVVPTEVLKTDVSG
jgi:hypothetical protein